MVRTTDSSLVDAWESAGELPEGGAPPQAEGAVVADRHGMEVMVRNALFARVRLAALDRTRELGNLDEEWGFGERAWNAALTTTSPSTTRSASTATRGPPPT